MQFWHMKDVRLLKLLIGKEDIIYQNERSETGNCFTTVITGIPVDSFGGDFKASWFPNYRISP